MNKLIYKTSFLFMLGCIYFLKIEAQIGGQTSFDRQLNAKDDQPVREFVESKENIDLKDKAQNLEISGDVRFDWRCLQEKGQVLFSDPDEYDFNYETFPKMVRNLRGGGHVDKLGVPISTQDFSILFNLRIRYTFENTWANAQLLFRSPVGVRASHNCSGVYPVFNRQGTRVVDKLPRNTRHSLKGSGEIFFVNLRRAFIGYNIYADGKRRLDIEFGRQELGDIFTSQLQFTNRFDGVIFKYASELGRLLDCYVNAGGFVIDERVNHFGYGIEIGFIDILDSGLDLRYNLIDWRKKGKNRCFILNPLGTDFLNSQVEFDYYFSTTVCSHKIPIDIYGGCLINHAAKKTVYTHDKKKNFAWNAGIYIGNVDQKGDWALDVHYLHIEAQAVSDQDVGGIGRGNILNTDLFDNVDFSHSSPLHDYYDYIDDSNPLTTFLPRCGNANFCGWRFEFLYALTDNFLINTSFEFTNEEDKHIGGKHQYRNFELQLLYAF